MTKYRKIQKKLSRLGTNLMTRLNHLKWLKATQNLFFGFVTTSGLFIPKLVCVSGPINFGTAFSMHSLKKNFKRKIFDSMSVRLNTEKKTTQTRQFFLFKIQRITLLFKATNFTLQLYKATTSTSSHRLFSSRQLLLAVSRMIYIPN